MARRDRALALPLVRRELERDHVPFPVFEAAELLADPSLVALLEPFAEPGGDPGLDRAVDGAIAACRGEETAR